MLSPEERAEKIVDRMQDVGLVCSTTQKECWKAIYESLAAQIREAEKEAYEMGKLWGECEVQDAYLKGRASMREEAAKVAEEYLSVTGYQPCCDAIRAIAVKGK